jgi:hypothetical protein
VRLTVRHLPRVDLAEVTYTPSWWRRLRGERVTTLYAERTKIGWVWLTGLPVRDERVELELDRARREAIRQHDK